MALRSLSPCVHQFSSRRGQEEGGKALALSCLVVCVKVAGTLHWFPEEPQSSAAISGALSQQLEEQKPPFHPQHESTWNSCELHGGKAQTDSDLQPLVANMFKNSQCKQDAGWGRRGGRGKEACTSSSPYYLHYTSWLLWQYPINRAVINSSLQHRGEGCPQVVTLL